MKDNSFTHRCAEIMLRKEVVMNQEFMSKMKEAKKMEGEAIMLLLPENIRGHVEIIEKEMKAMVMECVVECMKNVKKSDTEDKDGSSKVNKVRID